MSEKMTFEEATKRIGQIKPVYGRVALFKDTPEEMSKGGIILPDVGKEKPWTGKVIATGPGKILQNGDHAIMEVGPGDKIAYERYAGYTVEIAGVEVHFIDAEQVICILEEAKDD